jgi:hypothetical protein
MAVFRGTRYDDLYEMIGMMESASTVVPVGTPTIRVVGGYDMTR